MDQVLRIKIAGRGECDATRRNLYSLPQHLIRLLPDLTAAASQKCQADTTLEDQKLVSRAANSINLLLGNVALHDLNQQIRLISVTGGQAQLVQHRCDERLSLDIRLNTCVIGDKDRLRIVLVAVLPHPNGLSGVSRILLTDHFDLSMHWHELQAKLFHVHRCDCGARRLFDRTRLLGCRGDVLQH